MTSVCPFLILTDFLTYNFVLVIFKVYDSDCNGKVTFDDIMEVLRDLTGSFISDKQREVCYIYYLFHSLSFWYWVLFTKTEFRKFLICTRCMNSLLILLGPKQSGRYAETNNCKSWRRKIRDKENYIKRNILFWYGLTNRPTHMRN